MERRYRIGAGTWTGFFSPKLLPGPIERSTETDSESPLTEHLLSKRDRIDTTSAGQIESGSSKGAVRDVKRCTTGADLDSPWDIAHFRLEQPDGTVNLDAAMVGKLWRAFRAGLVVTDYRCRK